MSDLDLSRGTNSNLTRDTGSSKNLKDQVGEASAQVKQRAGDALQATVDTAQDKFKEVSGAAKDLAAGAVDQIQNQAREQQRSGAEFVERLAGNVREAARAFESDIPFAARGINSAADYVEDAADKIRNGSFRDLIDGATDFAKRQPAAFLGLSVLAGFAAVRFLKASSGETGSRSSATQSWASPSQGDSWRSSSGMSGSAGQTSMPGASRPSSAGQTSTSTGSRPMTGQTPMQTTPRPATSPAQNATWQPTTPKGGSTT